MNTNEVVGQDGIGFRNPESEAHFVFWSGAFEGMHQFECSYYCSKFRLVCSWLAKRVKLRGYLGFSWKGRDFLAEFHDS